MNAINWFEIPAANFERAVKFYEQILAAPLPIDASFPGMRMAMLPYAEPGVGGCLLEFEQARPHADGVRVYLNGGERACPTGTSCGRRRAGCPYGVPVHGSTSPPRTVERLQCGAGTRELSFALKAKPR